MLHLIERLVPPPVHRTALRVAHRIRHLWRRLAKLHLSGVSVIVRDPDGRVLLVRHSYGTGKWSVPGGGLKRGEEPEDCARREMREELGVELRDVALAGTLEESLSGARHTAHVFTACAVGQLKPDGREIVEARYFPLDDLPAALSAPAARRLELIAPR